MHYVYLVQSVTDTGFYIGYSANLRSRIKQHAKGESFATSFGGPWKLIYYEAYLNQVDVLGREKYLKSGAGRRFLKAQLRNYFGGTGNGLNRVAKQCGTQRTLRGTRTC